MYTMRTNADIADLFTPIEDALRYCVTASYHLYMTGRKAISDPERELLALPCRPGGQEPPFKFKLPTLRISVAPICFFYQ